MTRREKHPTFPSIIVLPRQAKNDTPTTTMAMAILLYQKIIRTWPNHHAPCIALIRRRQEEGVCKRDRRLAWERTIEMRGVWQEAQVDCEAAYSQV
jgi:hypothetical protein